MKTRLLKKVMEKYSIVKKEYKSKYNKPRCEFMVLNRLNVLDYIFANIFYVVSTITIENKYYEIIDSYETESEAIKGLRRHIFNQYANKEVTKTYSKVWHV